MLGPQFGLVTPDNQKFQCEADLHESFVTDRNTIIVTAYNATPADLTPLGGPKNGWVYEGQFYEIEPESGKILFRWSSLDHVPVSASRLPLKGSGKNSSAPFDYFHINSVVNIGKNNYLVNARHTWTTHLVSSKTGSIIWTLQGETGGDFGPLPANGHFRWQHYARPHSITSSSFHLSYFNNYNQAVDNGTNATNGLFYSLPLPPSKKSSPTLLKRLEVPSQPLFSESQGSTELLPNGNVFIGYGSIAVVREFGPANDGSDLRWQARFAPNDAVQSYRGFKQIWHGYPTYPPSLFVEKDPDCDCYKGYVSWNGATEVKAYKVFAGPSTRRLKFVGKVGKKGFGTEFTVGGACVQIAPVDRKGKVGRRSKVVCAK